MENSHTYTPAKSKIFQFSHSVSVERSLYNAYGTSTGKKHYVDRNIYMFMCVLTELYVQCTIFFLMFWATERVNSHTYTYTFTADWIKETKIYKKITRATTTILSASAIKRHALLIYATFGWVNCIFYIKSERKMFNRRKKQHKNVYFHLIFHRFLSLYTHTHTFI